MHWYTVFKLKALSLDLKFRFITLSPVSPLEMFSLAAVHGFYERVSSNHPAHGVFHLDDPKERGENKSITLPSRRTLTSAKRRNRRRQQKIELPAVKNDHFMTVFEQSKARTSYSLLSANEEAQRWLKKKASVEFWRNSLPKNPISLEPSRVLFAVLARENNIAEVRSD